MFRAIPLFVLPLIAYNLLMLTGDVQATLSSELFSVNLISGALWQFSVHDAFIVAGVLILYFEIFKSTRAGISSGSFPAVMAWSSTMQKMQSYSSCISTHRLSAPR